MQWLQNGTICLLFLVFDSNNQTHWNVNWVCSFDRMLLAMRMETVFIENSSKTMLSMLNCVPWSANKHDIYTNLYAILYRFHFIRFELIWFELVGFFLSILFISSVGFHIYFFLLCSFVYLLWYDLCSSMDKNKENAKNIVEIEKKNLINFLLKNFYENTKKIVWELQNRTQTDYTIASYANETKKQHVFVYREKERSYTPENLRAKKWLNGNLSRRKEQNFKQHQ